MFFGEADTGDGDEVSVGLFIGRMELVVLNDVGMSLVCPNPALGYSGKVEQPAVIYKSLFGSDRHSNYLFWFWFYIFCKNAKKVFNFTNFLSLAYEVLLSSFQLYFLLYTSGISLVCISRIVSSGFPIIF